MSGVGSRYDIHRPKKWKTHQISSHDPTDGNADYRTIQPHETYTIGEIHGPGCVSRIWFAIHSDDPFILRRLLLRFTWDNSETPAVYVPMGDFFGVGFSEYVHHYNAMHGMTSGGFFSYWPMPFNAKARLEVENRSESMVSHLYYNIQIHQLDDPQDAYYFQCKFNRENPTTIDKNFTILNIDGAGHYAGCVLSMQSYDKGSLLMLQGDEFIRVDNELVPSIIGTGTEDYFQGGWFWNQGTFHALYHGLTVMDEKNSRFSAYRLHVPDPIPFNDSIDVSIEHSHSNMLQQDYSSAAFWYQSTPDSDFGMIPEDPAFLTPIGTKDGAYLMSELIQDTPINRIRRPVIHDAAKYRFELREAKKKGEIPSWFEGVDELDFMKADYDCLERLVLRIKQKRVSKA